MKHLLKLSRKKAPKPPQQPILSGNPSHVAAESSGFPTNPTALPEDEGGNMDPRIEFQDRMDGDKLLPASGAARFAVVPDDADDTDRDATKGTSNARKEEIGWAGVSRPAEEAQGNTLSEGANEVSEKFGPLKIALESVLAIYANLEGIVALGNKIELLLRRVVTLEEHFDSRPSGVAEWRRIDELIRREELICQLRRFEEQLRSLPGERKSQELTDRIQDDDDAFRLLDDIQEAILNYQMVSRTMIDNQTLENLDSADAKVLNNFRCAQEAEYRQGNRTGCLKGTRSAVLDGIELWAHDFTKPHVYWLNGLAGTGKSTIAQTVAERMFADGRLGASFFCSRDFEDRSNLQFIFPTLAVQLARTYPEFRSIFIPLAQRDPGVARESLCGQMNKLIVQPLVRSSISTVIVIDALDECKDEEPASAILSVLGQFVAKIPKVKFFITGRPELRIRTGFRLPLLAEATDVFVLHEVEPDQVNNDVRLFFKHSFSQIKARQPVPVDWPTQEQADLLCERAAGLFVYAVATVRCIDQKNKNPERQLERLLQSTENKMEGKTKLKANATLDSLYMAILNEAFDEDDPEDYPKVRSILGAVILAANPLSPSAIATLLGFDSREVSSLLSSMHSLLVLRDDIHYPVRPFHKSLPDFLSDPARCTDSRFRVSAPDQHTEILIGCLGLMNQKLERNMCRLPDRVANAEVKDLKERTTRYIVEALQYACRSWHKHIVEVTTTRTPDIPSPLRQFLEEKFIFWLEVLSVLDSAREAVDALETSARRAVASSALDLINDYSRFVVAFFEVISTSAPHIYHSALFLSPRTSVVHGRYKRYARPLARVAWGAPVSWGESVATSCGDTGVGGVAWSPCNRFIAVARPTVVQLLDAATLALLEDFHPRGFLGGGTSLSFSPDSRSLTLYASERITTWDLQTGGKAVDFPANYGFSSSSTHSIDGRSFAVLSGNDFNADITAYDLLLGTCTGHFRASTGRAVPPIWPHDECTRFATVKDRFITISEVGFTSASTQTPVEVESFPAPDRITSARMYLFLPALSRLAFASPEATEVWDARHSRTLLECTGKEASTMSFSTDGHLFAYVTYWGEELFMWKESATGYGLHQRFQLPSSTLKNLIFSPCGRSIIIASESIHRLSTAGPVVSPSSISTPSSPRTNFTLAFSPDESFAAIARDRGNTITVVDLRSGDRRLVVETDVKTRALGMTGSTLIAVDDGKAVTWTIPVGDQVFNAGMDINESVPTTPVLDTTFLDQPGLSSGGLFLFCSASISPALNRIAVAWGFSGLGQLRVYDISTDKDLGGIKTSKVGAPRFTPDGCEVWIGDPFVTEGWAVVENEGSDLIELEPLEDTACPPGIFPWRSPHGHHVRDSDGWVLNSAQERILWLPNHWRSGKWVWEWGGRFLGLLNKDLPEAVILELCD